MLSHPAPNPGRPELDDRDLVRRAQLGSAAAFEQLVLRHGPRLHRYLVLQLRGDALDVLQEVLTAAWLGLPGLKDPAKFWPWLARIAAHKAADAGRRGARLPEWELDPARPDDSLLELREALDTLPSHQREVLLLRYLVGLSEEETAEALGIRVGTVKSRCARARDALLELLG